MDVLKVILIVLAALIVAGCAYSPWGTAAPGAAVYTYEHKMGDEVCSLQITSGREVIGGDIYINENCEVESRADNAGGGDQVLEVIDNLIQRIPAVGVAP